MDEGVRLLFERALDGEPAASGGDMAREARAAGRRLRRRRGLAVGAAAGVGAAVVGAIAVTAAPQPAGDTTLPAPSRVAMMVADPRCAVPATREATDAVVLLRMDITDRQRHDLDARLRSDPRVRGVKFESQEQAYARFKQIYADAPDLLRAVRVDQLPELFRVSLVEPSAYEGFFAQLTNTGGVEEVAGFRCPDGPSKGVGR
jgi:hypothetical protein